MTLPTVGTVSGQVGPMGVAVGACGEPGGSREPREGAVMIPAHQVRWLDERELCGLVHDYVHFEAPPDFRGCAAYRTGYCSWAGYGVRCAFMELDTAAVWTKARDWKRLPGGGMLYDPENRVSPARR